MSGWTASDFPVDTNANVLLSMTKFDVNLRAGRWSDEDVAGLYARFATYIDPIFDMSAIGNVVCGTHGTAGTTHYIYVAIPNYPINDPTGFQPNADVLPGPPPYGRPNSLQTLYGPVEGGITTLQYDRTRRYPGGSAFVTALVDARVTLTTGNATLSASNYNTIQAPNPTLNIPGTLYDICLWDGSKYNLVANDVAPNATVNDKGLAKPVYSIYTHTEVGWDTTPNPDRAIYQVATIAFV